MLDYIERHKIGILATIVIHLFLVTLFMVIQFGSLKNKKQKQEVLIDFVDPEVMQKAIEEKKEEVKKLSQQEFIRDLQKEYQAGKNIAVNEAEHDASQSVDKMVQDIKGELNIHDNRSTERLAPQQKLEEINKKDAAVTSKKPEYTENARGERTFYKGPTTITYFLQGRNHVYIPVPVYKCQGSGKVSMEIEVNRSGYVITATVNKSKSQITEECLIEAATRAALTTRFNVNNSASEKQRGWITYIFIAQ
jgi:hypothetical protein